MASGICPQAGQHHPGRADKEGFCHFMSRAQMEKPADEYIKPMQIKTASQDKAIKSLTGGNQRKMVLAQRFCPIRMI